MGIFKRSASEEEASFVDMRDNMLKNIWLAGLGAYSKSLEEVNQISGKSRTLFDELLERGREVEERNREQAFSAQSRTAAAFESRMHQIVQKVTGVDSHKLETVDTKLDQLTSQIEQLLQATQDPSDVVEAIEEKPEEKKAAAKKAAPNVARRKTAAKKPAAAKAATDEK